MKKPTATRSSPSRSSCSSAPWWPWPAARAAPRVGGVPVFALCVGLAFVIQWVAFVPAYLLQTRALLRPHRQRDLRHGDGRRRAAHARHRRPLDPAARDGRRSGRCGWATYLFRRIRKAGKDARFDAIKPSFPRFLNAWTLQGLWVSLTLAAALAAITTTSARICRAR